MFFIVGGNGLVGHAFIKFFKKNKIPFKNIQRHNYQDFINKKCDTVIYANGNANKSLANSNPSFDYSNTVTSVVNYLQGLKFNRFIYFSSVDVYQNTSSNIVTRESSLKIPNFKCTYGFNKFISEKYVEMYAKKYLIFRLGGLVGDKLYKNPVYDLFNKQIVFSSLKSQMNFIHTDFIPEIVMKLLSKGIENEVFNLSSRNNIKLQDIVNFFSLKKPRYYNKKSSKIIQNYRINNSKISKYTNLPSSIDSIKKYKDNLGNS